MRGASGIRAVALALCAGLLFSCGGGGGSTRSVIPPAAPSPVVSPGSIAPTASGSGNVALTFSIPGTATQSRGRKPEFISSGTLGISVTVYLHSDTAHAHPIVTTAADIGPSSTICTTTAPRTCTIVLPVPANPAGDSYDLVATLFDAAPVGGMIPATAHALGVGNIVGQTIVANGRNNLSVPVLGIPAGASITLAPPGTSTLGQHATLPLVITVFDASGATIQGAYATPLLLTSSDGSGATAFSVNGSSSTTIASSADAIALTYSGAPITATISVAGVPAAKVITLVFTPGANPPTVSQATLALSAGTPSATITVSESGYAGSFTPVTTTCASIATITPNTASAGTQTFAITKGASTGMCTIAFTDTSSQSVVVTVTVSGSLSASPALIAAPVEGLAQTITVTEPGYNGTFTQTNACGPIAIVTPPSVSAGNAHFSVSPGNSAGSCTVTIRDSQANSTIVSITIAQPLSVSNNNVSTPIDGSTSTTIVANESGYAGVFSVSNNTCATKATISPTTSNGPTSTVTIARGTTLGACSFQIMDTNGQTQTVNVTNAAPNALSASSTNITMPADGTISTSFSVSETGYSVGSFNVNSNTCGTLASLTPGSLISGSQPFVLTRSLASGTCTIVLSDAYAQTVTIHVTVAAVTPLTLGPIGTISTNQTFNDTYSEGGYINGTLSFAFSPACSGGSVTPASVSNSSSGNVGILGTSGGMCTVVATDVYGQTASQSVTFVGPPASGGAVTVPFLSPFNANATASEPGYTGSWSESDTCSGIATVTGVTTSGPTPSYTVSRTKTGACLVTLTDGFSRSVSDPVSVPSPIQGGASVAIDSANNRIFVGNETNAATAQAVFQFQISTGNFIQNPPLPGACCGSGTYVRILNGTLYTIPFGGPVQAYSLPSLTAGPSFGGGAHPVSDYAGIARDSSGHLYVPNGNSNVVDVYTSAGVFSTSFGVSYPIGAAIDSSDNFYTYSNTAGTIKKYDSSHAFVGNITLSPAPPSISDLWIDVDGNLWVSSYGGNLIAKYTLTGTQLLSISTPSPTGIDVDASLNVFVTSINNNAVYEYNGYSTGALIQTIK